MASGQHQLGIAVSCSGSGTWYSTIGKESSQQAHGSCTTQGFVSALAPITDPGKAHTVEFSVPRGVSYWVTIYSAK